MPVNKINDLRLAPARRIHTQRNFILRQLETSTNSKTETEKDPMDRRGVIL